MSSVISSRPSRRSALARFASYVHLVKAKVSLPRDVSPEDAASATIAYIADHWPLPGLLEAEERQRHLYYLRRMMTTVGLRAARKGLADDVISLPMDVEDTEIAPTSLDIDKLISEAVADRIVPPGPALLWRTIMGARSGRGVQALTESEVRFALQKMRDVSTNHGKPVFLSTEIDGETQYAIRCCMKRLCIVATPVKEDAGAPLPLRVTRRNDEVMRAVPGVIRSLDTLAGAQSGVRSAFADAFGLAIATIYKWTERHSGRMRRFLHGRLLDGGRRPA